MAQPQELVSLIQGLYNDQKSADTLIYVSPRFWKAQENFQGNLENDPETTLFRAHRGVLTYWSPIFRHMLEGPYQERESVSLYLEKTDAPAFEQMLKFMYGLQVALEDLETPLFQLAKKYQIQRLREHCVKHLRLRTRKEPEFAYTLLDLGTILEEPALVKEACEIIVTENNLKASVRLMNLRPDAFETLIQSPSWNLSEYQILDLVIQWSLLGGRGQELPRILSRVEFNNMEVGLLQNLAQHSWQTIASLAQCALDRKTSLHSPAISKRRGTSLFGWQPTEGFQVSGSHSECCAVASDISRFAAICGDRALTTGIYEWKVRIVRTSRHWIFLGIREAQDEAPISFRGSGRMIYCLDSRLFHKCRKKELMPVTRLGNEDILHFILNLDRGTLSIGVNGMPPKTCFNDLEGQNSYLPCADLRDSQDMIQVMSITSF